MTVVGENKLEDFAERDSAAVDARAPLYSLGDLVVGGNGSLTLTANYKHGIYSDKKLTINDLSVNVKKSASDGIRGKKAVEIHNATIITDKTSKHAINSDNSSVLIDNCSVDITLRKADAKGVASKTDLVCQNSDLNLKLLANATKGLKSCGSIELTGCTINAEAKGGLLIEGEDKSYCSVIKCDSCLTIDSCIATVLHEGEGGKGFSSDSTFILKDSRIEMLLTGNGAPYLINNSSELDFYTPRCIESKEDMQIISGEYSLHATGTGGKGIVCDSVLTIGKKGQADELLKINITTEGTAVINDVIADERFGCPKAIKCGKELYFESGIVYTQTMGMGGEGVESKGYITFNGGTLVSEAFDDGINVEKGIIINGGNIYCSSIDNDGIDSNGFIELNDGIVASLTSHNMDESFDCEADDFFLNGGTICGIGRDYSEIYKVNQPYIQHISIYKDKINNIIDSIAVINILKDKFISYSDSLGNIVMTAKVHDNIEAAYMTMSSPSLRDKTIVNVFQTDCLPQGAKIIIEGKIWEGGKFDSSLTALFYETASIEPYKDSVLKGDVNSDGRFSSADVSMAVEYALGREPKNGNKNAADVNGDGKISSADISLIISLIFTTINN